MSSVKGYIAAGSAIGLLVVIIVTHAVVSAFGGTGYFNHKVNADEVGIVFKGGRPTQVLGPGVYTCWPCVGQFLDVKNINVHGLQFTASDPEVITKDQYRIGASVTGTVLKPGVAQSDKLLKDWANYNQFYTSDAALVGITTKDKNGQDVVSTPGLMQQYAQQALKVCIGNTNFTEAVVGSGRDAVRQCVDNEMTSLAANYDLTIQNVVVPNFVLTPALQKQLDDQAAATQAVQVAKQQAEQATAEGQRQVAAQEAQIQIATSKDQEQARQDKVTAGLTASAAEAQAQAITAQKANELLTAQKDLEINQAKAKAAAELAQANNADSAALAAIYQSNPQYAQYQMTKANADAIGKTDKTLIVQPGTNVNTILGNGQTPIIANATK